MGLAARGSLATLVLAVLGALLSPDRIIRALSRFDEADSPHFTPADLAPSEELLEIRKLNVAAELIAPFVVVISPQDAKQPATGEWLANWLTEHQEAFRKVFFRHGAVIFRGFNVPSPVAFETVALAVNKELAKTYLGTSPRSSINGTTYVHTAADFGQHRTLPTHIEMSFRDHPPALQVFYARKVEHTAGGETPLTDFQGVWDTIRAQEHLRHKFEGKHVRYIRNYDDSRSVSSVDPTMQKAWQEMFKTDAHDIVLEKCSAESFDCSFNEENRLSIQNTQPWVRTHPVSGAQIWFNHINVLVKDSMVYDYERTAALWGGLRGMWPMAIGLYYRVLFAGLSYMWPEAKFGSSSFFSEQGIPITGDDFYQVKRAVWKNTVQNPYQLHDIVFVDNFRVGHGREMYAGPQTSRQILTAWSDNYPPSWSASAPNSA
mmetsp:Transcript_78809/g.228846  ORF Transcript_78809/g.228846 Transcript_78809/m.228846 type:complete len:432 (-) Transcript_78809:135-1430(-)